MYANNARNADATKEYMSVTKESRMDTIRAETHKPPRRKMPHTASFCVTGIRSLQTIGIGDARIRQSVTTLAAALPTKKEDTLMQWPCAVGSVYCFQKK